MPHHCLLVFLLAWHSKGIASSYHYHSLVAMASASMNLFPLDVLRHSNRVCYSKLFFFPATNGEPGGCGARGSAAGAQVLFLAKTPRWTARRGRGGGRCWGSDV